MARVSAASSWPGAARPAVARPSWPGAARRHDADRGLRSAAAPGGGFARPQLRELGDVRGEPIDIDGVGPEVVPMPVPELAVSLVRRVGDRFEELGISPRTADVLGRAAALGIEQAGIKPARDGIEQALDRDLVLPAIAEVVEVLQRLSSDILEHAIEPRLARVEEVVAPIPIGIRRAPADAARPDLVEMAVGPAHGR